MSDFSCCQSTSKLRLLSVFKYYSFFQILIWNFEETVCISFKSSLPKFNLSMQSTVGTRNGLVFDSLFLLICDLGIIFQMMLRSSKLGIKSIRVLPVFMHYSSCLLQSKRSDANIHHIYLSYQPPLFNTPKNIGVSQLRLCLIVSEWQTKGQQDYMGISVSSSEEVRRLQVADQYYHSHRAHLLERRAQHGPQQQQLGCSDQKSKPKHLTTEPHQAVTSPSPTQMYYKTLQLVNDASLGEYGLKGRTERHEGQRGKARVEDTLRVTKSNAADEVNALSMRSRKVKLSRK